MNAYQDYRESRAYQEINPDGSNGSVYWFAIHGNRHHVEVWLMVGEEVRFVETLHGPAAHVRALHVADSWLAFARQIDQGIGGPGAQPPARVKGPAPIDSHL